MAAVQAQVEIALPQRGRRKAARQRRHADLRRRDRAAREAVRLLLRRRARHRSRLRGAQSFSPIGALFILGEIIHNPEVNEQIARARASRTSSATNKKPTSRTSRRTTSSSSPPSAPTSTTLARIKERGCQIVDTTCGDVMSVWKRVRQNANDDVTSIIHGKASHEETKATASRAIVEGKGHYLVVLTLADTDYVCDYIRHGGDKEAFLEKFSGAHSEGFDPDLHLRRVGVANQTTMMRGETEEVQRRIEAAMRDRDGAEQARDRASAFSTPSAAPRRSGRTRCATCSPRRWTCCSSSAATTARTPRTSPKWARPSCPPTSSATPAASNRASASSTTTMHAKREVATEDWLPRPPAHHRHHRRRELPEQPHRGDHPPRLSSCTASRASNCWPSARRVQKTP